VVIEAQEKHLGSVSRKRTCLPRLMACFQTITYFMENLLMRFAIQNEKMKNNRERDEIGQSQT